MAKASSLLAVVDAAASSYRHRTTWFDRLDADAKSELMAARKKWRDGGYTLKRLTLARMIVEAARERGWPVCDATRMSEWLRKND
jgi:hypothetical protein